MASWPFSASPQTSKSPSRSGVRKRLYELPDCHRRRALTARARAPPQHIGQMLTSDAERPTGVDYSMLGIEQFQQLVVLNKCHRRVDSALTPMSGHSRRLEDRIRELCATIVASKDQDELALILPELKTAIHQAIERVRINAVAVLGSSRALPNERRKIPRNVPRKPAVELLRGSEDRVFPVYELARFDSVIHFEFPHVFSGTGCKTLAVTPRSGSSIPWRIS